MNKKPRFSREYLAYLDSFKWAGKRAIVLQRSKGRCEKCGSAREISVHHKHYQTLFREDPGDLIALCSYCHPIADWTRKNEVRRLPQWASGREKPWPSRRKLKEHYKNSFKQYHTPTSQHSLRACGSSG